MYGFALQSDKDKVGARKVILRGSQSQYRAHFHLVRGIKQDQIKWVDVSALEVSKRQFASIFLNSAGELAIGEYAEELRGFGTRKTYNQILREYAVSRTFFKFSSLEEALGSVMELQQKLLQTWLDVSDYIGNQQIELAGTHINLSQGCVPGFTVIKPSRNDMKLKQLDRCEWLVAPFAIPLPATLL